MKTLNLILVFANILLYSLIWQIIFVKDLVLFPDVGQGKSFILKDSRVVLVYDTGKENLKILKALQKVLPFYKKDIDLLIISHPDTDHYLALNFLKEKYKIRFLLITKETLQDLSFLKLAQELTRRGTKIIYLKAKDRIFFNKTSLLVLHPDKNYQKDNDNSLVIYGKTKNLTYLLTGDIEKEGIKANLFNYLPLLKNVEILDYPHHGSKYSLEKDFFEKLNPKIVIIQSGPNKYGHPHLEVINFFKNKNLWLTNYYGDFILDLGYN